MLRRLSQILIWGIFAAVSLSGCITVGSGTSRSTRSSSSDLEAKVDRLIEGQVYNEKALSYLAEQARREGGGEISIFFGPGSAWIPPSSLSEERFVGFLDYLSREARGREIYLVYVVSTSAPGGIDFNQKLALRRLQSVSNLTRLYLKDVPHRTAKVINLGEHQSPAEGGLAVHRRYRKVRVIAVYDVQDLPPLVDHLGNAVTVTAPETAH